MNLVAIKVTAMLTLGGLSGCSLVGPASLSSGRAAYNEVINATEDEQLLNLIVRDRYDETASMLSVSSVTASIRVAGSIGADIGLGPRGAYDGNLVPLSAGLTYEENPTISYTPLRGEDFVRRMLTPIPLGQALLLGRAADDGFEPFKFVIRRVNGLDNPLFVESGRPGFEEFIDTLVRLRDDGLLDFVHDEAGGHVMLLQMSLQHADTQGLLELLGIEAPGDGHGRVSIPIRSSIGGAASTDGVSIETPSALEVIRLAGTGLGVPQEHLDDAFARSTGTRTEFIRITSAKSPPRAAPFATRYRGWWFYIDPRDSTSKRAYVLLRTLVGMRLADPAPASGSPILTVPITR